MTRDELEQVIYERTRNFVGERVMDCILELIAEEREACVKACKEKVGPLGKDNFGEFWVDKCVAAIRARGDK